MWLQYNLTLLSNSIPSASEQKVTWYEKCLLSLNMRWDLYTWKAGPYLVCYLQKLEHYDFIIKLDT